MTTLFKTSTGELRWGWTAVVIIIGTILSGILMNTLLVTVVMIELSSQGLAQVQAMEEATTVANSFIAQVFVSVLQLGVMLLLVRWLIRKVERRHFRWSKLGLVPRDFSRYVIPGVILAIALSLFTIGIGSLTGTLEYVGNGFDLFGVPQTISSIFLGAILALASGAGEEIAFRGYLQTCIARRYNPVAAGAIVAVLFALAHPIGSSQYPLLYFLMAVLVGMLFGMVFIRTGSLWMGIVLHATWNFLQIAVAAIHRAADERFFGEPLFVFDNVSPLAQMLVEFGVILVALLAVIWYVKPVPKKEALYTH